MAATAAPPPAQAERPLGELLGELGRETTTLVRQEIELAKAETSETAQRYGKAAGVFGAAAVIGLAALGALTAFAILALAAVMADWLAALLVGVTLTAIAGSLALAAKSRLQAINPAPEQTIQTTKETVQWAKTQQ